MSTARSTRTSIAGRERRTRTGQGTALPTHARNVANSASVTRRRSVLVVVLVALRFDQGNCVFKIGTLPLVVGDAQFIGQRLNVGER